MTLTIRDYKGNKTEVDIGDIETIQKMKIIVVTGDEILQVMYKDYDLIYYHSCYSRTRDCYDGEFDIYDAGTGLNIIDDPNFINRTNYSLIWNRWILDSEGKIAFEEEDDDEEA